MNQRRGHQPGNEGGVFNWVPEPPATPAQLVVSPPGTQGNAQGQKHPGSRGPGPRPARPGGIQPSVQQGGNGKGKRHSQAYITHVEHGRVEHQAGVLQQGVQVFTVCRNVKIPQKRVGGDQHEQQKAYGNQRQNAQHPRHHGVRQLPGVNGYSKHPRAQHEHPQQQGAFMAAPDAGNPVHVRQLGVGVVGHIHHRKVVGEESVGQAAKRKSGQCPQEVGPGTRQRHPVPATGLPANHSERAQSQRDKQREDERKMANFRDHGCCLVSYFSVLMLCWALAWSRACWASGGM